MNREPRPEREGLFRKDSCALASPRTLGRYALGPTWDRSSRGRDSRCPNQTPFGAIEKPRLYYLNPCKHEQSQLPATSHGKPAEEVRLRSPVRQLSCPQPRSPSQAGPSTTRSP